MRRMIENLLSWLVGDRMHSEVGSVQITEKRDGRPCNMHEFGRQTTMADRCNYFEAMPNLVRLNDISMPSDLV